MLIAYQCIFYFSIPFIVLRLLWRSLKNPDYAKRINERFGLISKPTTKKNIIWLHAVSVGETIAAIPMIKQLQKCLPNHEFYITNTTPTGSAHTVKTFGKSIMHSYLPFDIPLTINRFLNIVQPSLIILMETEIWPTLLTRANKRKIPIMLANARLSERSYLRYAKLTTFTKKVLRCITITCAQQQEDADRFIKLGASANNIIVTNSIKFALSVEENIIAKAKEQRRQWGERPIWIAASTHSGEEEIVLQAHAAVKKQIPNCLLLLAPRHPERREQILKLCKQTSFNVAKRSTNETVTEKTDILLVDTLGELMLFYAMCDIAFVAGSFANIGGHNPIEPAALAKPIITGPQLFNFSHISKILEKAGAASIVADSNELSMQLIALFNHPKKREISGKSAAKIVEKNIGGLEKHIECIISLLHKDSPTSAQD